VLRRAEHGGPDLGGRGPVQERRLEGGPAGRVHAASQELLEDVLYLEPPVLGAGLDRLDDLGARRARVEQTAPALLAARVDGTAEQVRIQAVEEVLVGREQLATLQGFQERAKAPRPGGAGTWAATEGVRDGGGHEATPW